MILVAVFALLLATGHSVLAQSECKATYAAYIPKYIRPGVDFSVDVEILCKKSYDVEAILMSPDHVSSASAVVHEGETATLNLGALPYGYEGSKRFNVTVIGKEVETGEEIFRNITTDISYQNKFLSIFIESDKAIYQPGQTIKFRAAVTTPDLLPYQGTASYKLEDPIGNIILRDENAELTQGVVGSQFKLGRYSTQGEWRITYGVHGFEESLTVSVEEYVLPKFSAEIKTDQTFLHPGSKALTGKISATYTFGQPVKGNAHVEITHNKWWGRLRIPPKIVIQFPEFDGTGPFEVDAKEIEERLEWNPKQWSNGLIITAFVTDKTNGESANETKTIPLHRLRMKVETLAKPEHIKPGLPYVAYLKISLQDGSLLSDEELKSLVVEIEASYSYQRDWRLPWDQRKKDKIVKIPVKVGADGVIVLTTDAEMDDFIRVRFQVKIPSYPDQNQYWQSWNAERFESPSDTFLQVSTDDTLLAVGDVADLTVRRTLSEKNEESSSYKILLMARGKVLDSIIYTPKMVEETCELDYLSFKYNFIVGTEHSPSVYVVVSYIGEDGEFIADSVKINVQAALDHKVTVSTSTDSTDAGQPVSITVQADAGSFVGIRAIDQSVLLLKSGNDITQAKIFQDLDEYGPRRSRGGFWPRWGGWWWPWGVGGGDVSEVFENSGIIVLSDGIVYKSQPVYDQEFMALDGPVFFAFGGRAESADSDFEADSVGRDNADSDTLQMTSRTRSYFPESWIWTDNTAGDDGSVTFNYNTPDTITTWEISSFAMSNTKGLGVPKDTSKITVFRNFFISLNLPASAVRGEILAIKTTLFNYFDMEITATLTLTENDWYDLVIPPGADPIAAGSTRTVVIPSKDSRTVVFPVEFKKAGNARIEIKAQSPFAGDAVERTLVVKPEGIPKVVSHSSIIDRQDEFEPTSQVVFNVDIPDDAVEGSVYVKFSVSGNILGSALSNLGNLLKMPSGCGEQTMLNFAPDVYISLYLKEVGELKGAIKQKSQDHIREGYNNELRYQRRDGSFSAFGSSDRSGSTWLTAFVVKCFIAANELNPDLVEERKIDEAINFIRQQQNEDGTFKEPGRVIHTNMQGGVDSNETTAAYMVIAMAEGKGKKLNEDVNAVVKKAQNYLEGRIGKIQDIFTLSIVGYALSLVDSSESAKILAIIDKQAVFEGNAKYWKKEEDGVAKCNEREQYCPFDADKPSTSSIEITAYVLLLYVKTGRLDEVMPIVRWLVEQRGAFGGYHSTQDTVMAIQALATVAGRFTNRQTNLDINVGHSGKSDFNANFQLSDENAIVLQMADLPSLAGTVTTSATGVGVGDVQVTVGYNLPVGPRSDEPFVLAVNLDKTIPHQPILKLCSKINENRDVVVNNTGMYIVSFKLPTGYTINDKQATKDNDNTKLVELVGEEVTGYFDELPVGKDICMSLELNRYAEVAGVKPQIVEGYSYYKPAFKARQMINMDEENDICKLCGEACVGCPPISTTTNTTGTAEGFVKGPLQCCGPKTYLCPDFYDGLYYDSGSHVMKMINQSEASPVCTAPNGAGDSSTYKGLPASLFDGNKQYIECSNSQDFTRMLESKEGFTISVIIAPTEQYYHKRYTIFRIGSEDAKRPHITFSKRPRASQYWLKVLLNDHQIIIRSLHTYVIRQNTWSLITIRVKGTDVKFYLDGISTGQKNVRKLKTNDIADDVTMKIGRSHIGGKLSRGNYKGLVSNLDVWYKALTDEQIKEHAKCYKNILHAENPMLDLTKVRHVVPEAIRYCFVKPYTASELKRRAGDLSTACNQPGGSKPTLTPPGSSM